DRGEGRHLGERGDGERPEHCAHQLAAYVAHLLGQVHGAAVAVVGEEPDDHGGGERAKPRPRQRIARPQRHRRGEQARQGARRAGTGWASRLARERAGWAAPTAVTNSSARSSISRNAPVTAALARMLSTPSAVATASAASATVMAEAPGSSGLR